MGRAKLKTHVAAEHRQQQALAAQASSLIAAGEFDAAERLMLQDKGSLSLSAMMAQVYRDCLKAAVATGVSRELVVTMYHRAKASVCRCYPDPHTEIEAEQYDRAREENVRELVQIVGRGASGPATPSVAPGGGL